MYRESDNVRFLEFCATSHLTPNDHLYAAFVAGRDCPSREKDNEMALGAKLVADLRSGKLTRETALSRRIEIYASYGNPSPSPSMSSGKDLASGAARDV